ncbi:MAG: DUF4167 domain-containing protein [Sphingomonas bacterium]|nr:DUF4167 domain-containing protein [Sphingomonas bacterium]
MVFRRHCASATRKFSLINNRQGGRRRGRGGQQPRGMTGNTNSSGNRQDNRQRGNAAQLLEKYKSMARDAQLSGDRVQTEYYLQFADHYFRMLGDARPRFDEQKRQRGEDDQDDDGDDRLDSDMDNDGDGDGDLDGDGDEQPHRERGRSDEQPQRERGRSDEQPQRTSRPRPNNDRAEPRRDRPTVDRGTSERSEPRRERSNGRSSSEGNRNRDDERGPRDDNRDDNDDQRIDFAVLPPAIPSDDDDCAPTRSGADDAEETPKPRRRVRRPRAEEGDVTVS